MSRRKIIAGCYGAVVCGVGIWLEVHGHDMGSQIFSLSAVAIAAPIALGMIVKGLRQKWFWVALFCCVVLHLGFLVALRSQLPFENLEPAIILGVLEALALILLTGKIMDSGPEGKAAAAEFAERFPRLKRRKRV
jgi:hypothetical protein